MKNLRVAIFLSALAAITMCAAFNPAVGLIGAALSIFVIGNLLAAPTCRLMVTLSVNEILQDTLEAFKVMCPFLFDSFTTNFSSKTAKLNDVITGHISALPTVRSYDATTGYEANAAESEDLITDVPVTLNTLRHVPVKVDYLTALASKKNLYDEAIRNQAYMLGKKVVDDALALVLAANFTHKKTESVANTNLDTLESIRTSLNTQGNGPLGRFGMINSATAQQLMVDTRLTSGDYYGQLNGANGYRAFKNVAGFNNIWEYPDFPANAEALGGFFGTKRSIVICTRIPDANNDAVAALGIPAIARFAVATDPDSGLSLLGIYWQKAGLFDVYCTVALLYGIKAGAQGGSADTITDKAGVRLVTA